MLFIPRSRLTRNLFRNRSRDFEDGAREELGSDDGEDDFVGFFVFVMAVDAHFGGGASFGPG